MEKLIPNTQNLSPRIVRCDDWPDRLAGAVVALRSEGFDWAEMNCAFGVAALVQACTGVDLAEQWRPLVDSGLSAARVINEAGGLDRLVDAGGLARWESPRMARRLDIGLAAFDKAGSVVDYGLRPLRAALGVVVDHRVVFIGKDGLVWRPAAVLQVAWRIGN